MHYPLDRPYDTPQSATERFAGLLSLALAACAILFAIAAFALMQMNPTFQSEARILVKNLSAYPDGDTGAYLPRASQLRIHAEIASSDAFALELIDRLELGRRPEFSVRVSPVRAMLAAAGLASAESALMRDELILAALKRKMRVDYISNSPILSIRFRVSDEELAGALAGEAANTYTQLLQDSGFPPSSARPISHSSAPVTPPFGLCALLFAAAAAAFAQSRRMRRRRQDAAAIGVRVSRALLPERLGEPGLVRLPNGPDPTDIFSALLQNQR